MKPLKLKSTGQAVLLLEEILSRIGYDVIVSNYFGVSTDIAVKDFQAKNNLVVDGIVGLKTWAKLIEQDPQIIANNNKFLSEQDLIHFAEEYDVELATIKAVNEIESRGKGFLLDGRPKILFEGHWFWKQLKKRGVEPKDIQSPQNSDVLYKKWTRSKYLGGSGEYIRLEKAATLRNDPKFHDAAYTSASWGAFQIMGFHYEKLGYHSIDHFVGKMNEHEREHLIAFGKFLEANNIIKYLKAKNWDRFAYRYNGSGYKQNKYDEKLRKAYEKYKNLQ